MPLLNIVGISSNYLTFSSAFVFLKSETEEYYEWAMNQFKTYIDYRNDYTILFSTDRELSLINSIKSQFHNSKNLICTWNININILSNCQKYFTSDLDNWEAFMSEWNSVVRSHTLTIFDKK